jgi:hypothetical protein
MDDKKNQSADQRQAAQDAVREKQEQVDKQVADRQAQRGADPTGEREAHKDNPRPPRPAPGTQATHPNVPGEGYRPNPANGTQDLPPERQAPRPEDPATIGTGANKAGAATPAEPQRQPGFGRK